MEGQRLISSAYAYRQRVGFCATSSEVLCYEFWRHRAAGR
nr:MAG TPA: hypothetical protein [Caudoviricetes sp.]